MCSVLLLFVLYDSTVFLVSILSLLILRIELCRAPNTNSVISNERRLRTHTHKDPLTALLAIGVSSSALSASLCRGTRKSRGRAQRNVFRAEECAYQLSPRYSRNLPYSPNQTAPFFSVYSNLRPAAAEGRRRSHSL